LERLLSKRTRILGLWLATMLVSLIAAAVAINLKGRTTPWDYHLFREELLPIPFSVLYGCTLLLFANGTVLWKHLLPIGRMALTCYLVQFLIIIPLADKPVAIANKLPGAACVGIAVAIWTLLAFFSSWWLQSHVQGPVEA